MATRADFTDDEWKTMASGVTGAGMYVATADPGFRDNFKEASALARRLQAAHEHDESPLIRQLASEHQRPFGVTSSPAEIEQSTVDALQQGVAVLEAKSPADLPAYRALVLKVAEAVAAAAKGVSPRENAALERIRSAVGAT